MSRLAIPLLLIVPSHTVAAPVTAEDAIANFRSAFRAPGAPACPEAEEDAIVVCGRREGSSEHRLPLPVAPVAGSRTSDPLPNGVAAMSRNYDRCSAVGPHQSCSGGLPIPAMVGMLLKVVKEVVAPEE